MKRTHRRAHLVIWLLVAPLTLALLAVALTIRNPIPAPQSQPALTSESTP